MALINFTVNFDALAVLTDDSDAGTDPDIVALIGTVTFTPVFNDLRPALAPAYSPRPAGIKLLPVTGYIDADGQLKSARSGAVGVRLVARDPVLNLSSLFYRVDFNVTTPLGVKVPMEGGWFTAPPTDTAVNLAEVLQQTGSGSVGVTVGPAGPAGSTAALQYSTSAGFPATGESNAVYLARDTGDLFRWNGSAYQRISERVTTSGITDSTSVGRAVLTAADAAAARTAIGAGSITIASTAITDSTATGRSLVTAASQSAARTAISAGRNPGWYDVRDYGAVGNGVADDTAAIQAAIDATSATGGGTVFFPPGRFKLTSALSLGIFERNYVTLQGSGCGDMFGNDATGVTVLLQTSTSAAGISGYGTLGFGIRDMRITGPKSGTGIGIQLHHYGSASFNVLMENVLVNFFGGHGISLWGVCVSSFRNVYSMNNFDCGWNITKDCTSNSYTACWGGGNKNHGWLIDGANYSSWNGCASDGNGLDGWYFANGKVLALTGCGGEYNARDSFKLLSDPDYMFNITFNTCAAMGNRHHGWSIRGRSTFIAVEDCWESAQTNFIVGAATGNGTTTVVKLQPHLSTIAVGDLITLSDMTPSGYNGTWTVTAVNPDAAEYTVNCTATGTITALGYAQPWKSVTAASGTGSTATITVPGNVHCDVNDTIWVDGVTPTGYNGEWLVTNVAKVGSNTQISFAATATGSVTVQGYARVLTKSVFTEAPAVSRVTMMVGTSPPKYNGFRDTVHNQVDGYPTIMTGGGGNYVTQTWPRISGTLAVSLAPTAVKTAAYTAAVNDLVPVDATSGAVTITLPNAPADGARIAVRKTDSSANAVTIARAGSDVFNAAGGATSLSITTQNKAVTLQYHASPKIWYVVATTDM